jgi:protein SCO1/2
VTLSPHPTAGLETGATPQPGRGESTFAAAAFLGWFTITASWWLLAFAPVDRPPAWLDRARTVCFGTLPNGLPDTYGWLLLLLGPLSLLGFLVVAWGAPLRQAVARLARLKSGVALLAALAAIALGGSGAVVARVLAAQRDAVAFSVPGGASGDVRLDPGYARSFDVAPPIPLRDQHGKTIDLAALRGRPVLLTFAYAHCLTVCPTLVTTLHLAVQQMPRSAPAVLIVTLDPWRDTPGSLPALAASWRLEAIPNAHVLSGGVEEVLAVHKAYGIPAERDAKSGDIAHPSLIYVLDPQGRIAFRFLGPPPQWLVEAVARVERAV